MMSSNNKSKKTDGKHGINHAQVPKNRLSRKSFNNMADNSETRKNKNVDFGMTKESE